LKELVHSGDTTQYKYQNLSDLENSVVLKSDENQKSPQDGDVRVPRHPGVGAIQCKTHVNSTQTFNELITRNLRADKKALPMNVCVCKDNYIGRTCDE
jgi:hypothetical protein